jgi:hypothetical protein
MNPAFENMNRCYDGCPDSGLKARMDETKKLYDKVRKLNPNAHCTYFPMEEKYQVHDWGKPISTFHNHINGALLEAIAVLGNGQAVVEQSSNVV